LGAGFTIKLLCKDHIGTLRAIDPKTGGVAREYKNLTVPQLRAPKTPRTGKPNITETTTKAHVSAILQKMKGCSRMQTVTFASRLQLGKAQMSF